MTSDGTPPTTIVLVHGFWVTPRSREHWIDRYQQQGFTVLAPPYPGFEVEVESLRADTSPIEALTVPAIIEQYEGRSHLMPAEEGWEEIADRAVAWALEHA